MIGATRHRDRCQKCPPGSTTAADGVELELAGTDGRDLMRLIGAGRREKWCFHCRRLVLDALRAGGLS